MFWYVKPANSTFSECKNFRKRKVWFRVIAFMNNPFFFDSDHYRMVMGDRKGFKKTFLCSSLS
jgi:hypothetical protein